MGESHMRMVTIFRAMPSGFGQPSARGALAAQETCKQHLRNRPLKASPSAFGIHAHSVK